MHGRGMPESLLFFVIHIHGESSRYGPCREYTPEFAEAVLHTWAERCNDQQRQAAFEWR